jgi:hypothetical protein
VPVYNVALPMLKALFADQPFRVFDIPVGAAAAPTPASGAPAPAVEVAAP